MMKRGTFFKNISSLVLGLILLTCFLVACSQVDRPAERYNVLFIAVDDLRPELACYGKGNIHSPNIDQLAASSAVFERAYCQVPVCGASRASILTGLRPRSDRFLGYDARMDEDALEVSTLAMHFKDQGYYTLNYGKVSHFPDDRPDSWSEAPLRPDWHLMPDGSWSWEGWHDYQTASNIELDREHPKRAGLPYEKAEVPDSAYADGRTIDMAIRKLSVLKEMDQPFFFGLGILKPHLPFNAPAKYWDLYETANIQLADNPFVPMDAPSQGIPSWGELRAYAGVPGKGPVEDSMALKLIHGYYACVSYVDALLGRLLDELERLELDKNTVVVLWSDHGYFLGEHGFWCKHALYELACRVPLLIRVPGVEPRSIHTTVELIDLYPTMCELNGLPIPAHVQGRSFARAFTEEPYHHKDESYSRYFNGESILKDSFRYTIYFDDQGRKSAEMLYDHQKDLHENNNLARHPDMKDIRSELGSLIDSLRLSLKL